MYFLYGAFPRVLRNWLEHIFVFLLATRTPFACQVPLHTVGTQYMFTEWKFSFLEHDEAPPLNGFRGLHFPWTPPVRSDCPDEKVRAELLKRLILPLESGECMGRCETYGHHYRVMSLSMCMYVGIITLFLDCGSSQHGTTSHQEPAFRILSSLIVLFSRLPSLYNSSIWLQLSPNEWKMGRTQVEVSSPEWRPVMAKSLEQEWERCQED